MAPSPHDKEGMKTRELGALGEALVADYLLRRGFEIVARNLRLGRLELDLIARQGERLIVCEVKTRKRLSAGDPLAGFSAQKLGRVHEATLRYIHEFSPAFGEIRIDAALVLVDPIKKRAKIRYLEGVL